MTFVPKDMKRWLGDGGMAILGAIGVRFDDFGVEDDDHAGWATAIWEPATLACNPHGTVQAGVHAVVRETRQIAFAEARIESADGKLVSRATGTFLLNRAE